MADEVWGGVFLIYLGKCRKDIKFFLQNGVFCINIFTKVSKKVMLFLYQYQFISSWLSALKTKDTGSCLELER